MKWESERVMMSNTLRLPLGRQAADRDADCGSLPRCSHFNSTLHIPSSLLRSALLLSASRSIDS